MAEATTAIGRRLGTPDLPYVEFPPEGVKAALVGAGMPTKLPAWSSTSNSHATKGTSRRRGRTAASTSPRDSRTSKTTPCRRTRGQIDEDHRRTPLELPPSEASNFSVR